MEISRNKIPTEVLKFILEQDRKGIRHKQIAERVKGKFKLTIDQKEIGKLIMAAANGLDDESSQYEVK